MDVLPDDMIREIIQLIVPDVWGFVRVNKRVLRIFGQIRAKFEHLKIVCPADDPKMPDGAYTPIIVILENSLFPGKTLSIENDIYAGYCVINDWVKTDNFKWNKLIKTHQKVFVDKITNPDYEYRIIYNHALQFIEELIVVESHNNGRFCKIWKNKKLHKFSGKIKWENNDYATLKNSYNNTWVYKPSYYRNMFKHILKFSEVPEWMRNAYSKVILDLEKIFSVPGS